MMGLFTANCIGHIGSQVTLGQANGTDFCKFSVAVSAGRHDDDAVTWIQATAWGGLAKLCEQYATKGAAVAVNGAVRQSNWKTKSGESRQNIEMTIRDFRILDRPTGAELAVDELPFK